MSLQGIGYDASVEKRILMKTKTIVSLKDVADRVGVSRMTISLALRGDGRISAATRERVRLAALEMGYAPNPRIGELMAETARTRHGVSGETLAFLTSEPTPDGWKEFDSGTYQAVELCCREHGYRVAPWWIADPSQSPRRLNQILWSRGIRGIIIPNISQKLFGAWGGTLPIDWDNFQVVEIGGGLRYPPVNQVLHDHQAGLFMALDELESLGYQRIGLCLKSEDDLRTHHRWTGAYGVWLALRRHKPSLQPLIVKELEPAPFRRWVQQNRLEAVISPGILPLGKWGFKVPASLGFASLDLWGKQAKQTSGIDQQRDKVASAAVEMMITLLRRNQKGSLDTPMRWVLGGRWVAGKTTRQVQPVAMRPPGIENEPLECPSE
jgi:LacI family transcriptional regulator